MLPFGVTQCYNCYVTKKGNCCLVMSEQPVELSSVKTELPSKTLSRCVTTNSNMQIGMISVAGKKEICYLAKIWPICCNRLITEKNRGWNDEEIMPSSWCRSESQWASSTCCWVCHGYISGPTPFISLVYPSIHPSVRHCALSFF